MRCKFGILSAAIAVVFAMLVPIGCAGGSDGSPDILPHLISAPDLNPERPIDSREERAMSEFSGELTAAQYRARVGELYSTVVYDGMKPVFADGDPVKPIYTAAVDMLDRYVLNAWHTDADGEYNTVHALHDWLVVNIDYDFELYELYQSGDADLAENPAFHIDGVFLNGRAVCDGLSRAFNFLCAIEGIESVRVTGSFASAPHAWNKVRVSGKWYNLDVTSDAAYYTIGGPYKKQLSHGYFLLSDDTIAGFKPNGHAFGAQPYIAESDYDYYAEKTLGVGGGTYSCVVKSQSELNRLFEAVSDCKGSVGKIEVKLDFPNKVQINDADMYVNEIRAAYGQLGGSDFVFSESNKPYFRFPNGVYMFLMYK